jgi:hypothetical protein
VGKSWITETLLSNLLGRSLVLLARDTALFGEFNGVRENRVVISVEEYRHRADMIDAVKHAITGDTYILNRKGINHAERTSSTSWIFTANSATAYHVNEWAERGLILKIGLGIRGEKWKGLKDRAWNWHDVAAVLMAVDLTSWNPQDIPVSAGQQVQAVAAEEKFRPVSAWWRAVLTGECEGVAFEQKVPVDGLWHNFSTFDARSARTLDRRWFLRQLRAECYPSLPAPARIAQSSISEEALAMLPGPVFTIAEAVKENCVLLHSLTFCRAEFERMTKSRLAEICPSAAVDGAPC